MAKYKAEKTRRQQVLLLWSDGLKIKFIAQQLGVSERTVKRDLAKLMIYVKKIRTQLMRHKSMKEMEHFNCLSYKDQIEYAKEDQEYQKRYFRTKKCKALTITIDVDKVFEGKLNAVKFKPNLPADMQTDSKITLELTAAGRKQAITRIYIGKIVWGEANLQTNQSMNPFIKPTLKGLKITEPQP
ncbi:MAG: HTH domain-containing protein [Crenarchaeota archaeon]|nr:HTH domain-containing protein [Thermoproteota archaeon]